MNVALTRAASLAILTSLSLLCGPWLCPTAQAADNGKRLFERQWLPKDEFCQNGDGLGPMRNASSCVECHKQGGVGGAGPNQHNVVLLSTPQGATEILHLYGADDAYTAWRTKFVRHASFQPINALLEHAPPRTPRRTLAPQVVKLPQRVAEGRLASQRNTPALFGVGLIDAIADEELSRLAEAQSKNGKGGRVAPTASGAGKFGWRGQTATLREFVLAACANELGLGNDQQRQADNPLDANYRPPGLDLNEKQCDDLVEFVRQLPRPRQIMPPDPADRQLIVYGEQLFESVGCADCHVRNLGGVDGLYSDLLLHDMGEALADPSPAAGPLPTAGPLPAFLPALLSVYGGGSTNLPGPMLEQSKREWRTPPLWGVRDSAPYLHDGRAATLAEAIALHGGQARESAGAFARLPKADQRHLLAFLNTLAAP